MFVVHFFRSINFCSRAKRFVFVVNIVFSLYVCVRLRVVCVRVAWGWEKPLGSSSSRESTSCFRRKISVSLHYVRVSFALLLLAGSLFGWLLFSHASHLWSDVGEFERNENRFYGFKIIVFVCCVCICTRRSNGTHFLILTYTLSSTLLIHS